MIAQTVKLENVVAKPQPVQRVRRWVRDHYEWAVITQQQVEADKIRAAYVVEFDPCGMGGW